VSKKMAITKLIFEINIVYSICFDQNSSEQIFKKPAIIGDFILSIIFITTFFCGNWYVFKLYLNNDSLKQLKIEYALSL
jgi:hypothetical protein